MGAQGTGVLDFGAFPGSSVTHVDVSAPGVVSSSAIVISSVVGEFSAGPLAVTGDGLVLISSHTMPLQVVGPVSVTGSGLIVVEVQLPRGPNIIKDPTFLRPF